VAGADFIQHHVGHWRGDADIDFIFALGRHTAEKERTVKRATRRLAARSSVVYGLPVSTDKKGMSDSLCLISQFALPWFLC
jgi:hypothetical protein